MASLERENTTLGRELSEAQSRLGKGYFDPETTKVLHLAVNPVSQAREKILKDQIVQSSLRRDHRSSYSLFFVERQSDALFEPTFDIHFVLYSVPLIDCVLYFILFSLLG